MNGTLSKYNTRSCYPLVSLQLPSFYLSSEEIHLHLEREEQNLSFSKYDFRHHNVGGSIFNYFSFLIAGSSLFPNSRLSSKGEIFWFLTIYDPKSATEYQCGAKKNTALYTALYGSAGGNGTENEEVECVCVCVYAYMLMCTFPISSL